MSNQQCMKKTTREVILESSGNSKKKIYSNIFQNLRQEVFDDISGIILKIEPEEVYKLKEEKNEYTEKFLWLFMPRKKVEYKVKLKIVVSIKYIQL